MLGTLLTILKIIGIVLLSLLGLVLFLLLILLFVPVRYRIRAQKFEEADPAFDLVADATWLLHLVNFRLRYPGEVLYRLRVAFITLKEKRKGKEKTQESEEKPGEADEEKKEEGESSPREEETAAETAEEAAAETTEETAEEAAEEAATETTEETAEDPEREKEEKEKPTLSDFLDKVADFFDNIRFKIENICDKIRDVCDNIEYYAAVITSETFERALDLSRTDILKLLKAIRPRSVRGFLEFGSEEPDKTATVISAYSVIYPYIGNRFSFVPCFDRDVLRGDITLKGRITLCTVIVIAAKVYFNKDVKRTIRLFKKEKVNGNRR